ncbi:glycosyltransferase family 39 protein [Dokdonella sp.]|uniref:ArnT family glycosyltransferase n=1 Tax=Dokdonella sp. TaxID=2291710 RepID=UPI003C339371
MRQPVTPSLLLTTAIVVLLAFAFLGTRPIWDPDEGRYTNVALNMLESGDWMHPMRNEHIGHWTKPPMTYWVIASSVAAFGYNPWAARLPYALAFLVCVWVVWRIARRFMPGEENKAALIYATMFLPFGATQMVTTDFLLAASLSVAMMAWLESRFGNPDVSMRWVWLMWLGFGLGFMIKGPPALLPLLVVIASARLLPASAGRSAFHWTGLLIFALVALPWYIAVTQNVDGLLDYFLGREIVERLASSDQGRHGEWYGWLQIYAPTLILGSLPWTVHVWRWLRSLGSDMRSWRDPARRGDDSFGLILFLWMLLPLIVFCLARSRLPLYLLPLFTPLALIVARQMHLEGKQFPRLRWLALWILLLVGLRFATTFWPTHKNAESWADAIRERTTEKIEEVVFVEDMARYGIHLHLGATVDKVSINPVDLTLFDGEYDGNLDTELVDNDQAAIYICKQERWPELQSQLSARGYPTRVLGDTFNQRVIFRILPKASP